MRTLGVIIARGTSKRLPRKNLLPINGVPLIGYSCRAALASRIDRLILSTEDDEIGRVAEEYGVEAPFRRPSALSDDWARSEDILGHALDWAEEDEGKSYDVAILIQPTTPFVQSRHIDSCIEAMEDGKAACCFAVKKATEPPQWMFSIGEDGFSRQILGGVICGDSEHSQKLPASYFPTGAIYAVRPEEMKKQKRVICDPSRMVQMENEFSVDIDERIDLIYAESVAKHFNIQLTPTKGAGK